MNEYNIFGAIVDSDIDKSANDITLADFNDFINSVQDGDDVTFVFNSPGGSVTTGIAIANKIKALANRGIKTTAIVEGVCASISTCIACACDKIVLGKGSFFMIHNCWSVVQGDCNTLRKEADLMEKMNSAILSFYRSKFKATDEQLKQWMDQETWISSEDYTNFGLICEIDDFGTSYPIAASLKKFNFKNMPKFFNKNNILKDKSLMENEEIKEVTEEVKEETSQEETTVEQQEEVVEQPTTEEVKDPMAVEEFFEEEEEETKPTYEELENTIEELKKTIDELKKKLEEAEKPVEDRISGIQSAMQKNFNAKITDFTNQLKIKDVALKAANDRVDSLTKDFETCKKELSDMTTAYEAKDNALATLNARVNAIPEETPTMEDGLAKCSTPQERVKFLTSGKYTR